MKDHYSLRWALGEGIKGYCSCLTAALCLGLIGGGVAMWIVAEDPSIRDIAIYLALIAAGLVLPSLAGKELRYREPE